MSSHLRKNFITKNEDFECKNCLKSVNKLKSGCRNHCPYCLYSLHVDLNIPGDRENTCLALMKPEKIDYDGKKGYIIVFRCEKCGTEKRNRASDDDDFDLIVRLSGNEKCQTRSRKTFKKHSKNT